MDEGGVIPGAGGAVVRDRETYEGTEEPRNVIPPHTAPSDIASPSGFNAPEQSWEDLLLTLRIRETETLNRQLEVQAMQLRLRALEVERSPPIVTSETQPQQSNTTSRPFDVSRQIALGPPFRENEVDSYLTFDI